MIRLFWRERPSRKLVITLLFLTALIAVVFYRHPIATKSIEYFTQQHNLKITCLDFSFNWKLHLKIKHACFTSPVAKVAISEATWHLWSNVLSIKQIKIRHIKQRVTANKVDNVGKTEKESPREPTQEKLNIPDSLPLFGEISISSIEIDSYALRQPIELHVNSVSRHKLSITGDVNASVNMSPNSLTANVTWRLSDVIKWMPQAQTFSQDYAELLKDLASDQTLIKTNLTFDGTILKVDNTLDIDSRIYVSNCPMDTIIKGNVLLEVDISSFNTGLDLSRLTSDVVLQGCLLLQDYFAEDDLPQLSFIFPQKITMNKTQINLPELQIVDKQNTARSIVFNALNYQTTGQLDADYNISFKQPIRTIKGDADLVDFQGRGKISADLSTLAISDDQQPVNIKILDDNHRLVINNLKTDSWLIGNLTSEFSFKHSGPDPLELKGKINGSDIQIGDIKLAQTSSDFSVLGSNYNDLQLSIASQLSQFSHPEVRIKNITNHIDLHIKELETLRFSGDSSITNVVVQNINLLPINMTHSGQASLTHMNVSSQHKISLEHRFLVELEQQQTKVKAQISQQNIISLQSLISQLEKTAIINEGYLGAVIELTLPQEGEEFTAQGKVDFQGLSVKYQDYLFNDVTYHTPLTFDSAGLQLPGSTLHIDSVDVGVMIEQLEANVIAKNSVLRLTQVQGNIFNGRFSLADLWLDGREQQFTINIKNIDLAQVIALQQQPGIKITGNIDGDLPFIMGKKGIRIEDGWVTSLTGGKLTIIDNPSFDSIKDQQPQLALLENLDFTQLESNVKFTPDGWVLFDFALQGNNPDKKQSVNFNYSHQENIFPLLESIRLVKSIENTIENTIEQKITQGDKK